MQNYVDIYSKMNAKNAAAILGGMTSQLDLVTEILANMDASKRAAILQNMDPKIAGQIPVQLSKYDQINN